MPLRSALALAAALFTSTAALAAGGTFERTVHTSATPTVSVYTGSGAIHIHSGSSSEVHIKANLYSSNNHGLFGGGRDSDVQSRIQQIINNPPVQQNGDSVNIGEHGQDDLYRNINIDYDITLPAGSHLSLETGSGDIDVEAAGDGIHAHTGSGSIRAREVHGALDLQTGSGDIEVGSAGPGNVRAQSGSGSLRLRNLDGSLDAHTGSGDIEVAGHLTGDSSLHTGSGSVRLDLGHTGINLDAHTGSGTIRTNSSLTTSGEINREHVSGAINGGGPTVRIQTGSGDIELR